MNHFMRGFASELVKLAAAPQHERPGSYDTASSAEAVMHESQGGGARTGNKKGFPVATARAPRTAPPTPMTTPNENTGRLVG